MIKLTLITNDSEIKTTPPRGKLSLIASAGKFLIEVLEPKQSEPEHSPRYNVVMRLLTSTWIKSVELRNNTLHLNTFKGGSFIYSDITAQEFEDFKNAKCLVKHWVKHFKNKPQKQKVS